MSHKQQESTTNHHTIKKLSHHGTARSVELSNAAQLSKLGINSSVNEDTTIEINTTTTPNKQSLHHSPKNVSSSHSKKSKSYRKQESKTTPPNAKGRRQMVSEKVKLVHAQADEGTAVDSYQYGHQLKHKLNSKTQGTHPELRNKFDRHLIDVIRNTHSHLLDKVHKDIMEGIVKERIAQMTATATPNDNSNGHHKQEPETDVQKYAARMFAVSGVMMRDGVQDRNFISHKYDTTSLWYYELQYNWWYQLIMACIYFVLTFLVLFELPAPPSLILPTAFTLTIECLCLIGIYIEIIFRGKALRYPLQEKWYVKSDAGAMCSCNYR